MEQFFKSVWMARFMDLLPKVSIWAGLYFLGYFHLHTFLLILGTVYIGMYVLLDTKSMAKVKQMLSPNKDFSTIPSLPEWMLHPDRQRTEWANEFVQQLWPHCEVYVKQLLKQVENDQTLQERLAGYNVKSLKFTSISLGQISPSFSGIKVHSSTASLIRKDEIVVELSVTYAGDLSIEADIELDAEFFGSLVPTIKVKISNLSLSSPCLRIHLRPLLTTMPFVEKLTFSFTEKPHFDFDLDGSTPFKLLKVGNLLRHVIHDQLVETIVMPNSFTFTLAPKTVSDTLDKRTKPASQVGMPAGVLNVNIVEAKGLENKDTIFQGKSDPYAVLRITSDGETSIFKSSVVNDSLHPVWNMSVDLPVDNPEALDELLIDVYDKDVGSADDFLGSCKISKTVLRTAITTGQRQEVWKLLQDVKSGYIRAQVSWCELRLQPSPPENDLSRHRAVLAVVVESCTNLDGSKDGLRLPNPYVSIEVCQVVQETDPVVGCADPLFAHRMNFLVHDPNSDLLSVVVYDQRAGKGKVVIGTVKVRLSGLLFKSSLTMISNQFPLAAKKSNEPAQITLSMSLRYIHRPTTSGFGAHRNLQDLKKIIPSKPTSVVPARVQEPVQEQTPVVATKTNQTNSIPRPVSELPVVPPDDVVLVPVENDEGLTFKDLPKADKRTPPLTKKKTVTVSQEPPKYIETDFNSLDSEPTTTVVNGTCVEGGPRFTSTPFTSPESAPAKEPMFPELKKVQISESEIEPPKKVAVVTTTNKMPELKIKTEEATKFLRENSVEKNNLVNIYTNPKPKQPAKFEPPMPKIQLSLKYNLTTLTLSVVVHKIRNLQETSISWLPSACVKTRVIEMSRPGANRRVNNTKRKTKTQRRNTSPVFEETLEYFLPVGDIRKKRLEVSVFHDSRFLGKYIGRNVVLGRCIVSLDNLADQLTDNLTKKGIKNATVTEWFILLPPIRGEEGGKVVQRSGSLPRPNSLHANLRQGSPKRPRRSHSQNSFSDC